MFSVLFTVDRCDAFDLLNILYCSSYFQFSALNAQSKGEEKSVTKTKDLIVHCLGSDAACQRSE